MILPTGAHRPGNEVGPRQMKRTVKQIGFFNDEEEFVAVPHIWEICPCCEGSGATSSHLGDVTNWLANECDHDEREAYFAGHYDLPCDGCEGAGKVMYPDFAKMTPAIAAAYRLDRKIDADLRAEEAAERRFGC